MNALGRVVRALAWLFLGVNAYGLFVLVYVLTWGAAQEARTGRAAAAAGRLRDRVRVLEIVLAKHDLFQADVAELDRKLGVLGPSLPRSPETEGVLESLGAVARRSGVVVLEAAAGRPVPGELQVALPLTVRVRGPLPALASFADRLERLPRLVLVRRLALSAGSGTCTATLELEAFHRTPR